MIHFYGVVEALEGLPEIDGVDAQPLERRRIEGLDLVLSETPLEPSEVTQDAVLAHANVVEELMARSAAVLPARFGRAFANEEELADALRAKAPQLARGLNLVRGCVEFGLRALGGVADDEPSRLSGRGYMRARLAEEKARQRLATELHEPLARLARASTRFGGASSDLLRSAYLVSREDIAAFSEHVRSLETGHPEVTIVCTGPWPPYSFADNGEGDA
jgi:hypothetical protein